jgi:hypothetical protein
VEKCGEGVAEERPGAWAEGHEGVEDGSLAGGGEAGREEIGLSAGVEIEQVRTDGSAEVRLAVDLEGAVREVG